jgi:hypothetical protein
VSPKCQTFRRAAVRIGWRRPASSGGSSPKILGGPGPRASIPSPPLFLLPLPFHSLPFSSILFPSHPSPFLPFPLSLPLFLPSHSLPFERGSGGITPGKNFRIKDARRWVLEHFGNNKQHLYEPGFLTVTFEFQRNFGVPVTENV